MNNRIYKERKKAKTGVSLIWDNKFQSIKIILQKGISTVYQR